MDKEKYLQRINFTNDIGLDIKTLSELHEHHVFNVPFENLDIHYRRRFDLELERVYEKVLENSRGGFCYELNSLFNALLRQIGFKSKIISSRIIDDWGMLGPEYDHMAICIECQNKMYLAVVGFGDLFIRPLEIREGIQSDGKSRFMIEKFNDQDYALLMSSDGESFYEKYRFNLEEVPVERFADICLEKQTSPASYFVKNTICTKPTSLVRLTLKNDKFIEKKANQRTEKLIRNDDELRIVLKNNNGIVIR